MWSTKLKRSNSTINKLLPEDAAAHSWYRFVLSYPPQLVRNYLGRFGITAEHQVLDPFSGTGTTLVECKKLGIPSVGIEALPISRFATSVKVNWSPDPQGLWQHAQQVAEATRHELISAGIDDETIYRGSQSLLKRLPPDTAKLLLGNSIGAVPLHKSLVLLEKLIELYDERFYDHERLALAKALVNSISNLRFGPEVGVGPAKPDAPIIAPWLENVSAISNDLETLRDRQHIRATTYLADSRLVREVIRPKSIDAVITSPPYPNEKDYTRTTRLESVLLGFTTSRDELQSYKRTLVRSNTRTIYSGDNEDLWIRQLSSIKSLASKIENKRIELNKTSGFEKLYGAVTLQYFGGMAKHLVGLKDILKPGAQLAYVVGDQASYFQVLIQTGEILAEVAEHYGYEVIGIDLFRTRLATVTKDQMREEVVVLKWPGPERKVYSMSQTRGTSNSYLQIIERIFFSKYQQGMTEILFTREELNSTAAELGITIKNLGDIVYSLRYRAGLPESIRSTAPTSKVWIIRPAGRAAYQFALVSDEPIVPSRNLIDIKVPDSTPGIIAMYATNDEQALLAKVRYNHLINIFTGVTCYSLQNHLRTTVEGMGQVETDEIYVGVDQRGAHYVFPIQAKGGRDKLNIVQIEQDFALCQARFPELICKPIGTQFMENDVIALFAFQLTEDGVKIASERHYRLVPPSEMSVDDLRSYRDLLFD